MWWRIEGIRGILWCKFAWKRSDLLWLCLTVPDTLSSPWRNTRVCCGGDCSRTDGLRKAPHKRSLHQELHVVWLSWAGLCRGARCCRVNCLLSDPWQHGTQWESRLWDDKKVKYRLTYMWSLTHIYFWLNVRFQRVLVRVHAGMCPGASLSRLRTSTTCLQLPSGHVLLSVGEAGRPSPAAGAPREAEHGSVTLPMRLHPCKVAYHRFPCSNFLHPDSHEDAQNQQYEKVK